VAIVTAATTVRLSGWLAVVAFESFTWTVNDDIPAAVGVPDRDPAVLRLIPAGNVPEVKLH
jgi:hypothetical protein